MSYTIYYISGFIRQFVFIKLEEDETVSDINGKKKK